MKKALLYTLVFVALEALIPSLIGLMLGLFKASIPPDSARMMIISLTAANVATIALFLYLRWAEVSRSYVRSRPWDVFFWSALAAVGMVIPSTCLQEQMPELPNLVEQEFDMILKDRWGIRYAMTDGGDFLPWGCWLRSARSWCSAVPFCAPCCAGRPATGWPSPSRRCSSPSSTSIRRRCLMLSWQACCWAGSTIAPTVGAGHCPTLGEQFYSLRRL